MVQDKKLIMNLVQHGCKLIKENVGENVYHKGINMIDNRVKDKYKAKFRDMVSVDDSDKRMFKQKDNEINRKQFQEQIQNNKVRGKDKGFDLIDKIKLLTEIIKLLRVFIRLVSELINQFKRRIHHSSFDMFIL